MNGWTFFPNPRKQGKSHQHHHLNNEKIFGMCIHWWKEFDHREVNLFGWQDVKIQIFTNWLTN